MPIYQQGYRRYEARQALRGVRFWPITREALRALGGRKLTLVALVILMLIAWVPVLFWLGYLYVTTHMPLTPNAPRLPVDGQVFGLFLRAQEFFVFLMTVFAGAGLIANDLRTGGILIYLSRPLTLRDYVLGKLSALFALQLSVTLVPGLILYAAALGLSPERFAKWELAWIAPAIVAQSVLVAGTFSLVALAVSSLARSARLAGLMFFGGLIVMDAAAFGLRMAFRRPWPMLFSVRALLRTVGGTLFGLTDQTPKIHWSLALAVLALVAGGSLFVLRARVRAVEIVQ